LPTSGCELEGASVPIFFQRSEQSHTTQDTYTHIQTQDTHPPTHPHTQPHAPTHTCMPVGTHAGTHTFNNKVYVCMCAYNVLVSYCSSQQFFVVIVNASGTAIISRYSSHRPNIFKTSEAFSLMKIVTKSSPNLCKSPKKYVSNTSFCDFPPNYVFFYPNEVFVNVGGG